MEVNLKKFNAQKLYNSSSFNCQSFKIPNKNLLAVHIILWGMCNTVNNQLMS